MNTLDIIIAVVAWAFLTLLLLAVLSIRGRALVFKPILREKARPVTCRKCRLPFIESSWKCGRCGAYMKSHLLYKFGHLVLEPVLTILIIPWIVFFGILMSVTIWLTLLLLPRIAFIPEKIANRLGRWVAPLYGRWMPWEWRVYTRGAKLMPAEIDVPVEIISSAALILASCLLKQADETAELQVLRPNEDTLTLLRNTRGGVHEMWGYVSDNHVLVPTYQDQIVGALIRSENLLEYTEGLIHHLETPWNEAEIRPVTGVTGEEGDKVEGSSDWIFHLRRDPDSKGRYPITWEVHAEPTTLLKIESLIEDLSAWDSLPCQLTFR